jgi:hypothetical protein
MTDDDAVGAATRYLQNRFDTEWKDATHGLKLHIAPNDNQFMSDPDHPITGAGHLVSLTVRETTGEGASFLQRLKYSPLAFGNRYRARRFNLYVDPKGVDANGNPLVYQLDTVHLDAWSRLRDWAKPYRALPAGQLDKSLAGMGTLGASAYLGLGIGGGHAVLSAVAGGAGAAVTPVAPLIGVYGIAKAAAYLSRSAEALDTTTQNAAVNATASWLKNQIGAGRAPNLGTAYRYYTDQLAHDKVGTHLAPMDAYEFSRQLRGREL